MWQSPGRVSTYNLYSICIFCWISDTPDVLGLCVSYDIKPWALRAVSIKNTHHSSLPWHICPHIMYTWLLSKTYTWVHYSSVQKLLCVKKLLTQTPTSSAFVQSDSHFPSGLYPAVLLDCLSLCLCEDNIINMHYAVGSVSPQPSNYCFSWPVFSWTIDHNVKHYLLFLAVLHYFCIGFYIHELWI